MAEPVLRQILTSLVGAVRRIRVAVVEADGTEITLATAAKQDTLIAKDFATESTLSTLSTQLDIELSALRDAITAAGGDATTLYDLLVELQLIAAAFGGPGLDVDVQSSVLPTGASTDARQDTIIAELNDIKLVLEQIEINTRP